MLLSLQIMAMLTWKEMPCVENLQTIYCVNCRNTNIPGYCCQRSLFCDCYRNTGYFLCSEERIKRFVNVHLYCIVGNVPSKVRKYAGPPELFRSEISFSRTPTFQNNGNYLENKELFEWNVHLVRNLIRLFIYHIIHKAWNSLKTPLTQL